ncbi:hypothetical protein PFISCL1PPCAC_5925, partial [Pristionchus fissidentatus]
DTCRGEDKENRLMPVDRRHNYVHCPVHVILKQYNTKSYLVRFITNSSEIKLTTFDGEQFGCRLKQDIIDVIHSDNVDIEWFNSSLPTGTLKEMMCEFAVNYKISDVKGRGRIFFNPLIPVVPEGF